jgi:SAM-dependent methyltransferase
MDKKTVEKLNKLNRKFYLKTQEYFNKSRQYYWGGWGRKWIKVVKSHFQRKSLRVLDVGCGNGRFGEFLTKNLPEIKIEYAGIDNNKYLLLQAKKKVPGVKLLKRNILKNWKIGSKKYDLVVLIGILHHVPGEENRLKLLEKAKKYLKPEGLLTLTVWQFKKIDRLKKKIVDWGKIGFDKSRLERNDYLLSWDTGVKAYRYCHYTDHQELKRILKKLEMQLISSFEDDAKEGTGNKYVILKAAG